MVRVPSSGDDVIVFSDSSAITIKKRVAGIVWPSINDTWTVEHGSTATIKIVSIHVSHRAAAIADDVLVMLRWAKPRVNTVVRGNR